ncbi:hypothetical protein FLX07_03565 [Microbispora bryophytorum]|nr:hypothetical protein FLX07_03565 [Microbispora bryophytorum]
MGDATPTATTTVTPTATPTVVPRHTRPPDAYRHGHFRRHTPATATPTATATPAVTPTPVATSAARNLPRTWNTNGLHSVRYEGVVLAVPVAKTSLTV